jgi:hypothetical protein
LRTQKPRLEIERAQHSVRWQPNAGPRYDAASPSKQGKSCSKATVRLGPRLSHGVVAAAPPPSLPLASSAAPARLLLRPRRRRRGRRRRLEAQRHRRRRRCSPRPGPPPPFRGPPQLTGTSYCLASFHFLALLRRNLLDFHCQARAKLLTLLRQHLLSVLLIGAVSLRSFEWIKDFCVRSNSLT